MTKSVDFYLTNKNKSWVIKKIPEDFNSNIEKLIWIMKQPIGWIKLDINIDLNSWKKESLEADPYYVMHREGGNHQGWQSCCIHGIAVEKTGVWNIYSDSIVEPEYQWTELSDLTPTITNFWKKFPFEHLKRVRFMKVNSMGWVEPHNDTPPGIKKEDLDLLNHIIPINIAIVHPEKCYMTLENMGTVPWEEGSAFIINITNTHSVVNYSKQSRVHLIAHGIVGNKINDFAELIVKSYIKQYELSIL
jgi:hypothetical protein